MHERHFRFAARAVFGDRILLSTLEVWKDKLKRGGEIKTKRIESPCVQMAEEKRRKKKRVQGERCKEGRGTASAASSAQTREGPFTGSLTHLTHLPRRGHICARLSVQIRVCQPLQPCFAATCVRVCVCVMRRLDWCATSWAVCCWTKDSERTRVFVCVCGSQECVCVAVFYLPLTTRTP